MMDVAAFLLTWTPFLAVGFLWNVGVTLLAVAIGTGIGAWLGATAHRQAQSPGQC